MNTTRSIINRLRFWSGQLTGQKGNAIAYIAMVLIIFGVIGVVMTSLLTSAVVSTTTPNHSRRALYMTEAGMRYALSELRNTEDWTDRIQELNSTIYTVSAGETFTLNIFGPWYQSGSYQNKSTGDDLTLNVPEGELPLEYTMDTSSPHLSIVNYNYVGTTIPDESKAEIQGFNRIDANTIEFNLRDQFIVNDNELVCLAVKIDQETINQMPINSGDTIYVAEQARHVFPQYDGAIEINRSVYFYDELEHDDINDRVKLLNSTGRPESAFGADFDTGDVTISDYALLSNRNHYIVPSGTSENISAGGNLNEAINVADQTEHDVGIPPPDIDSDDFTDNLSEVETESAFIAVDTDADELNIGGGYTPPTNTAFGASWYDANLSVGGDDNYCQAGACLFGLGIRTFFTLYYSGEGDGLTFALLNALNNGTMSVGGDIQQSELLAYAGDSRLDIAGTTFLDGSGSGLQAPKIDVEFDMKTNYDAAFETTSPRDYCIGGNLKPNTRNDPLIPPPVVDDRDAIQYVYWGDTTLTIPCRNDHVSYDDNRHDAESTDSYSTWEYSAQAPVKSSPTIDPGDGTIYFGSDSNFSANFYALNPDGSEKWPPIDVGGNILSKPAIDASGHIYFGSTNNNVYGYLPDGTQKWSNLTGDSVQSSPAIDLTGGPHDGTIYIGSDDNNLYAYAPDGNQKWAFDTGGAVRSSPAVDPIDGTIYVGTGTQGVNDDGKLLAINPHATTPTLKWEFIPDGNLDSDDDVESSPVIGPDGTIYVGSDDGFLYAVDRNGNLVWRYDVGGDIESKPAISAADNSVYGVSENNKITALNLNTGVYKWDFPLSTSSSADQDSAPEVGPDGTVYVGSDDNRLYALNPDGSEKWQFSTGGDVLSSPTINPVTGIVYVGAEDSKLYATSGYARPRNIRDLMITSIKDGANVKVGGEIVEVLDEDDWLKGDPLKGPWAIRIEVTRSPAVNGGGNYDYTMHSWARQCNELDCSDVTGTFYQDTRAQYDGKPPHIEQVIELTPADHASFNRFLFGFTGATGTGVSQNAIIEKFQLSFIRPGDPVITVDPDWP